MREVFSRDGFVTVRGLRFHYLDYGGQGQAVLALHGLIQNAHAFDSIAPFLVPHVHLLALDLRGRGESDWGPPERYRIPAYVADLTAFVDWLGIRQLALIGTSLGGIVARVYAAAHPRRVTHLVLNDCAIGADLTGTYRAAKRPSAAPAAFSDLNEAISWFRSERDGLARLDESTIRTWVAHYLTQDADGRLCFRCDQAIILHASQAADELMTDEGACRVVAQQKIGWQHAQRLTMPVLLLRGSLSDVILRETAERFTHTLPSARCVDIPGAGHSPTLYEPEARTAIIDFFGIPSCQGIPMPSRCFTTAP